MGFLDKLLGRSEEASTDVKDAGEDVMQKSEEMGESGKERGEDVAQDAKTEVSDLTDRDQP